METLKSYKSYAIILALALALILMGLYFFVIQSSPTTIALPLISPVKIYVDITNDKISDHIHQKIADNSDYEEMNNREEADIVIDCSNQENSQLLYQEPLAVVVHPQTTTENINLDQLTNITSQSFENYNQLVAIESNIPGLPKGIDSASEDFISVKNKEELINYLYNQPNAIGLIPLSDLDIKLMPLGVDSISIFDETEEYPLQLKIYVSGENQNEMNNFLEAIQPLPKKQVVTSILAVGDIMMGRYVGVKISRSGDNTHSFQYTSNYLKQPDITFAQLETPIAPTTLTSEGMILVAQPNTVDGLIESGIDIVSLSGNHFGDALRDGMEYTFNLLEDNNILYIGAGRNEEEALDYQIIEKNDTRFGFISFVNIMPASYGAEGDIAGSAWVDFDSDYDLQKVKDRVEVAKENCDILLVGFHWGTEYTPHPTANQIKFAHTAIDSGADIIVGTHPHVVQADEMYKGKYIIYSLGNFIMDQMWSTETTEGVLMPIYVLDNKIISVDLEPTRIIDYSQVKIISKEEGSEILQRIWDANEVLL